tara:strand:- start:218 stop:427 length:210 start_codon:yes stop_codon:yes gene_type:complete
MTKFYPTIKKRRISKTQKHTPMIYQQIWSICWSIKKQNPKIHKALLKDLMKLEEDKYYTQAELKERKYE